jgi:CRISPR-associated protein Cas5t
MEVLRIEVEAPACSFRYPHFLVGRQLTFDMPPPATIYGHIASAIGDFPDARKLRFAYRFTSAGKVDDLETQHIVKRGKPPEPQPVRRQFLFDAHLTLYLEAPELEPFFREPRFPVVLGRSQDLACYSAIEIVTLEAAEHGYYEHTILPADYRRRTGRGVTVLMPSYIAPPPMREPEFRAFIVLAERIYSGPEIGLGSRQMLTIAGEDGGVLVDPDSPEWNGAHRALCFHSFKAVGEP